MTALPIRAQTLSSNSGINSNDTYCVFDLTVQTQANLETAAPIYNPTAGAMTQTLALDGIALTYHVEAGYDTAGNLAINLWPTGTPPGPSSIASPISVIRLAGGNVTVFDENGVPLALSTGSAAGLLPANLPIFAGALNASVLEGLVIASPPAYAQTHNATSADIYGNQSVYAVTMSDARAQGNSATWNYTQSGSEYVATSVTYVNSDTTAPGTSTLQFANVSWHDNAGADAARAQNGAAPPSPPPPTATNYTVPQPDFGSCSSETNIGPGTQNILFQHGLASCASTWDRMYGWLMPKFEFGTEVQPSLSSLDALSYQQGQLTSVLDGQTQKQFILVGHSQGGLLSRGVAQALFTNRVDSPVAAVVTVDTPNQGAPIALDGAIALNSFLDHWINKFNYDAACGTGTLIDTTSCYVLNEFFSDLGTGALTLFAQQSAVPATADLVPGSAYLNNLNAGTEIFPQVGITSYTNPRWIEARLMGDFIGGPEDGRFFVDTMEVGYDALFADYVFSTIVGDCYQAEYDANVMTDLDLIDFFYNEIVSPQGEASDGVVPVDSQQYPNSSAAQISIPNADSHVGATRSDKVRDALVQALNVDLRVPLQTGCTVQVTGAGQTFGPAADSGSLGVTASAGCGWSAMSEADWITITSGASGMGNGSVGFSFGSNAGNIPRSGEIEVDSATGSTLITVNQNGGCTYTLGYGALIFTATGGSGFVPVTTQAGCAWSAVPSAPWMTITAGQTGNGSGSFNYQVAVNNSAANLAGSIGVMGQSLSVTEGDGQGSAASGSIEIEDIYVSPRICNPDSNPCQFSGTITAAVNGWSTSVSYDQDSADSDVAQALATAFNTPASPVVAAFNGNHGLTLTTKLTGLASDYALSASASNSGQGGFTVVPSGSTLTGGSN